MNSKGFGSLLVSGGLRRSVLGRLRDLFAASWGVLGASWGRLGTALVRLGRQNRLGAVLEPFWSRAGSVLEASWGRLGAS